MTPSFVSVVVPTAPGTEAAVRAELQRLDAAAGATKVALQKLGIVHFMSMSLIKECHMPHGYLLIELTTDYAAETSLRLIADRLAGHLGPLFIAGRVSRYCPSDTVGFLISHSITVGTNWTGRRRLDQVTGLPFSGLPGMTAERVRREEGLAGRIVQTGLLHGPDSAFCKLSRVRNAIWADGDQKWAFFAESTPFLEPLRPKSAVASAMIVVAGLVPLVWPVLLAPVVGVMLAGAAGVRLSLLAAMLTVVAVWLLAALLAYWQLTRSETADAVDDKAPDPETAALALARENQGPLNLLITVSRIKPGWFRRFVLRGVFQVIREVNRRTGRPGYLGPNCEVGTLHSGRWLVLPGTDLLLFVAHYSGSWLSYMQDFVDLLQVAPTAIWSNTLGFPRTSKLFEGGVADGDRVTRWFHRQQRPIDFWFADSPSLPLVRIRTNAAIRNGFAAASTEQDAQAWLALFGAPSPPSRETLPRESGEIPTLAYGALTHLHHAACLVFDFIGSPTECKAWLASIEPRLSYGRVPKGPASFAHVLGLSAAALRALGLPETDLRTFPIAFANGMTAPERARILGDGPEALKWGDGKMSSCAILLVYAKCSRLLEQKIAALPNCCGVVQRRRIDLQARRKGNLTEPFGFRDGLSQPVIPGTPAFDQNAPPDQVVNPGEFVLGYKDNYGYYPPVPSVAATPVDFGLSALPDGRADLGHNSSFLVVRQLQQNVKRFDGFAQEAALQLGKSVDYVKAKLLGRWPNGSSLVRNSETAGDAPDNDFRFAAEDIDGLACPRGAHIRRANPRDLLHPDLADPVKPVNRRRIMRVGRPYVDTPEGEPQGMLFMCLNADIERQFELVQQAWLRNANFDSLRDEVDPILGASGGAGSFTIPTRDGPVCLRGLPSFVTTLGGGYFWLPSRPALAYLAR